MMRICMLFLLMLTGGIVCLGQWYETGPQDVGLLSSVRFINDSVGITVGQNGVVLRTFDRGMSWDSLPNDLNVDFFDFQFINDTLIYGYGSDKVYFSVDTGNTWMEQSGLPRGAKFAYFLDTGTGFAGGNIGGLHRTVDGGINWTMVWTYPGEGISYSEQNDIAFFNDSVGFSCGRTLKTGAGGYGNIIRTLDRGSTWEIAWESPTRYSLNNPSRIQVLGDSGIIAGDEYFSLIKSFDAGESWTVMQFEPPEPETWSGMSMRAMYALNLDTIVMVGEITVWAVKAGNFNRRKILRSCDRGESWIIQYIDDPKDLSIAPFMMGERIFLNDSIGICPGNNLLLRTSNLGGEIHIMDTIGGPDGMDNFSGDPGLIRIYPNPTSGLLTVELKTDNYCFVQIFTPEGRLIKTQFLYGTTALDISEYPAGLYILRFAGQQILYHRIVKTQ